MRQPGTDVAELSENRKALFVQVGPYEDSHDDADPYADQRSKNHADGPILANSLLVICEPLFLPVSEAPQI
jgi:hypothetical protein